MIPEKFSYFLFKNRLRKKLKELYRIEDPWESVHLSQVFSPIIRKQLAALPEKTAKLPWLDAGGGEAHYLDSLRDVIPEYHGVDINEAALKRARARLGGTPGRFFRCSLDRFRPAKETYGVVLLISVLNYLGAAQHPHIVRDILSRLWDACHRDGLMLLIHPCYSEEELSRLKALTAGLIRRGAAVRLQEAFSLGKQDFWLECLQKR